MTEHHEATLAAIKAAPPAGVSMWSLCGLPLNEWVAVVTIVYVLLQIWVLVRDKFVRDKPPADK